MICSSTGLWKNVWESTASILRCALFSPSFSPGTEHLYASNSQNSHTRTCVSTCVVYSAVCVHLPTRLPHPPQFPCGSLCCGLPCPFPLHCGCGWRRPSRLGARLLGMRAFRNAGMQRSTSSASSPSVAVVRFATTTLEGCARVLKRRGCEAWLGAAGGRHTNGAGGGSLRRRRWTTSLFICLSVYLPVVPTCTFSTYLATC